VEWRWEYGDILLEMGGRRRYGSSWGTDREGDEDWTVKKD